MPSSPLLQNLLSYVIGHFQFFYIVYESIFYILSSLAIIVSAFLFVKYRKAKAKLSISLDAKWLNKDGQQAKVQIDIKNVTQFKVEGLSMQIGINTYPKNVQELGEYVWFEKDIKKIKQNKHRSSAVEPDNAMEMLDTSVYQIMMTTAKVEPQETISVQRLLSFDEEDYNIVIGLQVKGKNGTDRWTTARTISKAELT